jgi:hypothetical protein
MNENGESKSRVLRIRVTPTEESLFKQAAAAAQRNLSDWTRLALLKEAGVDGKPRRVPALGGPPRAGAVSEGRV